MAALKVGLVGLRRGQGLVKTLQAHPRVAIRALCDNDESTLEDSGRAFGLPDSGLFRRYEEFVQADLDAVVIATPIEFHKEQSIAAMEAGKHVLCEQTAAYTVRDCEALIETVKRTGKAYMMAENYCYFHYIREWKRIIDEGKIGKVFYSEAEYIHEIVDLLVDPESGKRRWRYTRPPILYCAHTLGPLLMLTNDRIVRATGLHSGKNIYPDEEGMGFLDMEVGLFQTQNGAVIKILRSQTARRYGKDNSHMVWYSLYGTNGFLEVGREGGGNTQGLSYFSESMTKEGGAEPYRCPVSDPGAPETAGAGGHGTSEHFMVNDFVEAIENGSRPPIDVIRAVEFTVPGIVAHESAMKGGVWMDVPQYGW